MVTVGNTCSSSGTPSLPALKPPVVASNADDGVVTAPTSTAPTLAVKPSIVDSYA